MFHLELIKNYIYYSYRLSDSKIEDIASLRSMIERMPTPKGFTSLSAKVALELEHELFGERSPFSLFRGVHTYFYKNLKEHNFTSTQEIIFKFHAGITDKTVTETTNYVVVSDK